MENNQRPPTAHEADAALSEARAAEQSLLRRVAAPPSLLPVLGLAVALQIAGTAAGVAGTVAGVAGIGRYPGWLILAVNSVFVLVVVVELAHFRAVTGVRLDGLLHRVLAGTAPAAATSYVLALGAALWAGFSARWWLVAVAAIAGGVAYAASGRAWLRNYRAAPADHARDGSLPAFAAGAILAVGAGMALLLVSMG